MNVKSLKHGLANEPHFVVIAALAAGLAVSVGPGCVADHAVPFTVVDSTADAVDANPGDGVCATATGECTLRAAIMEANALPGDDTITLPAGTYTLTIVGADEDAATTGDLDITSNLTINGAGANSTIIAASGIDRVLAVIGSTAVNISGVRITGGNPGGFASGGGIRNMNNSVLTLSNVTVSGNSAFAGGGIANDSGSTLTLNNSAISSNSASATGGILNLGTMTINNSSISGNTAEQGGGISNGLGNTLTINNSTISGNISTSNIVGPGGGISNSGTLIVTNSIISDNSGPGLGIGGNPTLTKITISNSTISGNSTPFHGGGIQALTGNINLNNVTITGNTSNSDNVGIGDGGGISVDGEAILNLRNTIIAGNMNTGGQAPDCSGVLNSQGYNLIQHTDGCTITGDTTGNLTGVDPLLGPLQDNGGPTFTHALLPGSLAIDAGNPAPPGSGGNACEATDQRGVARPQSAHCDMGAFEMEAGS